MNNFSLYIHKLNNRFWLRIFNHVDTSLESIGIFRILLGVFMLLLNTPVYGWISQAPETFFNPPLLSPASLFHRFLPDPVLVTIDCIIVVSLLCITIGVKAKLFSLIFFALNLFGDSFVYSFGKIDHEILLTALIGCMAFSGWGVKFALWADPEPKAGSTQKSLAIFALLICFGMFTAGSLKAIRWIDFDFSTGGFLSWYYRGYYSLDRRFLLAPIIQNMPVWLFEFADYGAVFFELSPIFFLLKSKNAWLVWILIACLFHLANTLVLNISFHFHFLVYLVFLDYSGLSQRLRWRFPKSILINQMRYAAYLLATAVACIHFYLIATGMNSQFLFISQYQLERELKLYVALGLWAVAIALIVIELKRSDISIQELPDAKLAA